MSPSAPEVCVVCPTFRRPHLLRRLVTALEAQTHPLDRVEVRIVDDASGDATSEVLHELAAGSPLRLIPMRAPRNRGPAAARNLGWRASSAPVIAFTDDDCTPAPGWLAAGLAALRGDPAIGVVQGRVTRPLGAVLGPWTLFREHDVPTPYFEACNVFYRREALERCDGFDERFRFPYGEDTDLAWRVLEQGWRREFAFDASVEHDVEERGFAIHLRYGWLERHVVGIGARHPGFAEQAFWHRRAWRASNVAMAIALLGAGAAVVTPSLAVLTLPWLWMRWPRRGHRTMPLLGPQRALVDAVQLGGHLVGSIRHRTFLL